MPSLKKAELIEGIVYGHLLYAPKLMVNPMAISSDGYGHTKPQPPDSNSKIILPSAWMPITNPNPMQCYG
jgi:hypothetical protein